MYQKGVNYIGSNAVQTSTANQEVVPVAPEHWSRGYSFYKFSFYNDQSCTIKVNGGDPIYLREGQGFNTEVYDAPIRSFIIVEPSIRYNFVAAY
jgi:hypothetical protein